MKTFFNITEISKLLNRKQKKKEGGKADRQKKGKEKDKKKGKRKQKKEERKYNIACKVQKTETPASYSTV